MCRATCHPQSAGAIETGKRGHAVHLVMALLLPGLITVFFAASGMPYGVALGIAASFAVGSRCARLVLWDLRWWKHQGAWMHLLLAVVFCAVSLGISLAFCGLILG